MRKTGDQIKADIANSSGMQKRNRPVDIVPAMHAARSLQFDVRKRLHAETDAIDSGCGPRFDFGSFDRFGIGFKRDFVEAGRKRFTNGIKNTHKMRGIEKTRRAPAEINGVNAFRSQGFWQLNASRSQPASVLANLCLYSGRIGCETRTGHHAGMKIAVGTLRLAERYLNVDAEAHGLHKNCSTRDCSSLPANMVRGSLLPLPPGEVNPQ